MKTSNKCKWSDNSLMNKIKWRTKFFMIKKNMKRATKKLTKINPKKEIKIQKKSKRFQKDEIPKKNLKIDHCFYIFSNRKIENYYH